MLYREIIAVCSEIHTKHINTLCGQNVEIFDACVKELQNATTSFILFVGLFVCPVNTRRIFVK